MGVQFCSLESPHEFRTVSIISQRDGLELSNPVNGSWVRMCLGGKHIKAQMGLISKIIELVEDCLQFGIIPLIATYGWHIFRVLHMLL